MHSYGWYLTQFITGAKANHAQLRTFSAEWALNEFPQRDVPGSWVVCSPETAGNFSAVSYYCGLDLQEKLKVPVGLVTCAFGASAIESRFRKEALAAHPQLNELLQAFSEKCLAHRDDPKQFLDFGNATVKLNDRAIQIHGNAQHTSNEWPAVVYPCRSGSVMSATA